MDRDARRLRILGKLAEGTLPQQPFPRVWASPGRGERCDGCDGVVGRGELALGGRDRIDRAIQFHAECYRLWDRAREGWDEGVRAESVAPGPAARPRCE